MKRKLVSILTGLMIAVSATAVAAPAVNVDAAVLANGSQVSSVPVAGWVQAGTTAQNLLLHTAAGDFSIILDKNCVFGNTKYLVPGEIAVLDIYAGSDGKYHAADFQQNTVNANQAGAVAVSTALAADVTAASTSTSSSTTTNPNVQVIYTKSINGGVEAKSTSKTLYAVADGVEYIFTMDDKTDTSDCGLILPNYTYKIEFYRGDGAYNHVAKISDLSGNKVGTGSGVSAAIATVSGTVLSGTKQNELILKLDSQDNPMTIKIDATTDTSACRFVNIGQRIGVTVANGSDKYLHALTITDRSSETSEGRMGDAGMLTPTSTFHIALGTFTQDSNDDIVKMSVNGQEYQLRVDSGSKGSNVPAIRPGWSYSADIYLGTDGYNHIASFADQSGNASRANVTVNKNRQQTYTGTIHSSSTPNELHLVTGSNSNSYVRIRLDTTTDTTKCKVLRTGKRVTVTCGYGSDRYWHALSIARVQ